MSVLAALLSQTTTSTIQPEQPEARLRARLVACRHGITELETLRVKHLHILQEMRKRLPHVMALKQREDEEEGRTSRSKDEEEKGEDEEEKRKRQPPSPPPSTKIRPPSPLPSTTSHSSQSSTLSSDSGCASSFDPLATFDENLQPPMPYSTYRKKSIEEWSAGNLPTPIPSRIVMRSKRQGIRGAETKSGNPSLDKAGRPRSLCDRLCHDYPARQAAVALAFKHDTLERGPTSAEEKREVEEEKEEERSSLLSSDPPIRKLGVTETSGILPAEGHSRLHSLSSLSSSLPHNNQLSLPRLPEPTKKHPLTAEMTPAREIQHATLTECRLSPPLRAPSTPHIRRVCVPEKLFRSSVDCLQKNSPEQACLSTPRSTTALHGMQTKQENMTPSLSPRFSPHLVLQRSNSGGRRVRCSARLWQESEQL